jgi:branched-chain amino acid transport system substrate-binding protein
VTKAKSLIVRLLLALAALAVIAAACSSDDDGGDSAAPTEEATEEATAEATEEPTEEAGPVAADPSLEPFVIGSANMDEGIVEFPEVTKGSELAVTYINTELGGIDGHPLELRTCNPGLDNESNQACAEEYVNDEAVQVVSSGFLIGSAGFHPTFGESGKPHVGGQALVAPDYEAANTYYYYAGNPNGIGGLGVFALDFLDIELETAALIYDDPTGQSSTIDLTRILEEGGVEVTAVPVPTGAPDMIGPLTAAGAADVDAIFLLSLGCVQAANDLDILGVDVPVLTTGFCASPDFFEASGGKTGGWYLFTNGGQADADSTDDGAEFYRSVVATYDDIEDDDWFGLATQGFANILIIHQIASEIGWDNLSPEALNEGFFNFPGPVLLGAPDISCPGQDYYTICTGKSRVFQISEDGEDLIDATGGEFVDVYSR